MLDAAALRPDERALEPACGHGGVGLGAAELVTPEGEVVLSDIAPEYRLPDASFDVVLAREGLMLVPRDLNPRLGMLLDATTETLGIPGAAAGDAGSLLVVRVRPARGRNPDER